MFKNRSIRIQLMKDNNDLPSSETSVDQNDLVRAIAQGAMAVVAVYMAADTLRKILVHVVATKIQ